MECLHNNVQNRSYYRDPNMTLPPQLNDLLLEALRTLPARNRRETYLKSEVLSKYTTEDVATAGQRQIAAIRKWLSVERYNEKTNSRFGRILSGAPIPDIHLDGYCQARVLSTERVLSYARQRVSWILGETVPVAALHGSFSGGSSTSRLRTESQPAKKYAGEAHVTVEALPWFSLALSEAPGWGPYWYDLDIVEVVSNTMFTVPKNSDIDRVAAKEPDLNMYLQKGAGGYIRKRLKRVGIDLNDQSVNQELAREGSISGLISTIDLSSASDSVTTGLVEYLLPHQWFIFLDNIRSKRTLIMEDEVHVNEMFSSMGNGFTFELESLIFYSLAWAVRKELLGFRHFRENTRGLPISVYGDDIICPSLMAKELIAILGFCGFTVNEKKSFINLIGPFFRESCGKHYQDGVEITPFYLKGPVKDLTDLIHILNKMRYWSSRYVGHGAHWVETLDPMLEEPWRLFSYAVPQSLRGGYDYTLKTQLVTPEPAHSRLQEITKSTRESGRSAYVCWLNSTWSRSFLNEDTITEVSKLVKNTKTYRKRRVYVGWSGLTYKVPYWEHEQSG